MDQSWATKILVRTKQPKTKFLPEGTESAILIQFCNLRKSMAIKYYIDSQKLIFTRKITISQNILFQKIRKTNNQVWINDLHKRDIRKSVIFHEIKFSSNKIAENHVQ